MPDYQNPVTDQHVAHLDEAIRSAQQTAALCKDAAECGLPVDELAAQNAAQLEHARALKRKFAPNKP